MMQAHGGARRRGDGVGVMLWQPEKQFFIFEDATVAIKRNNNMLSAHYLLFLWEYTCENIHVLCDVDNYGDDKMNDHGLTHLAYVLLTVCCPWRDEMWLFWRWLFILWFPSILSCGFFAFLEHISHICHLWFCHKRQYKTLTVFKVHFFLGFLVFLSSEFYTFLQWSGWDGWMVIIGQRSSKSTFGA